VSKVFKTLKGEKQNDPRKADRRKTTCKTDLYSEETPGLKEKEGSRLRALAAEKEKKQAKFDRQRTRKQAISQVKVERKRDKGQSRRNVVVRPQ